MRVVTLAVVAATLVACSSPAAAPTGGIQGAVTAGPTCPVEIQGSPCPPRPWTGLIRATAEDGSTEETQTNADGSYRLALAPGSYQVTPVVEGTGPPTARPVTVTVGDAMQRLDLQVDTGIR
jgi:Carboxypeptidase regulatory-like domain